jgi:hypothetical protein
MPFRFPVSLAAIVAAALAVALAGCGGNARGGAPAAAPPTSAAAPAKPFMPNGPARRAVVWAVGDGASGSAAPAVAQLIARGHPDVFLYLGDVYPMGTAAAFRQGYTPAFGRFAPRTAPTPGNHDWPVRSAGYIPYWQHSRGVAPPAWYSFRAGGWELISLNSEASGSPQQLRWLRSQLRARGTCRLAFWHRPRFSGGIHGDNPDMQPFWDALEGHARLVVSGHDHDMQRFAQSGTLTQIVAGAGGYTHYAVNRRRAGLVFADDTHWGAVRIDLAPGRAKLAFVATSGRVLDTIQTRCSA